MICHPFFNLFSRECEKHFHGSTAAQNDGMKSSLSAPALLQASLS